MICAPRCYFGLCGDHVRFLRTTSILGKALARPLSFLISAYSKSLCGELVEGGPVRKVTSQKTSGGADDLPKKLEIVPAFGMQVSFVGAASTIATRFLSVLDLVLCAARMRQAYAARQLAIRQGRRFSVSE